ncbi:MAG TPA: cation:proton antiporter [Longimicrobiales bacterium]|nr:cation:proton antiporter [Longimicrobiales bacterium]
MRRAVILFLLFGAMQLLLPLGAEGQGSQTLLAFGFVILAAYTVGELATVVGLPKIVGYLFAGVVFGPYVLGTIPYEAAGRLEPVSQLAVALIAFLAGAELRWSEVRERGVALLKIMSVELAAAFIAIGVFLYLARGFIPPLADAGATELVAFILLFAAIAIVHSPAVTMALLTETGARGPVARTTLGVVLLADVAVVLLFSAVLAVARTLAPPEGVAGASLGLLVWEILGALLVGAVLGAAVAAYLRFVGKELVLFAVLVAFFGLEIARLAHVELLLTLLTAGFVAENTSPHGEELRSAMERSAAPIFVVFFALSGAKIDVGAVAPLLPLVVPLAAVRALAIWGGTRVGGAWADVSPPERPYAWMGLVSQAGVAIGLAAILAGAYGEAGVYLQGLLLALIAVNETVGPILFRRALGKAGEVPAAGEGAAEARAAPAEA